MFPTAPFALPTGPAQSRRKNGLSFPVLPQACPVCGNGTFNYRFVTTQYRVAACSVCGVLTRQRPPETVHDSEQERWRTARSLIAEERAPWMAVVHQLAPANSVVELGAAVVNQSTNGAELGVQNAGGVVAWDVLGFMARPDEFLRRIHELLANDGVLLLTVPAADGEQARRQRRLWPPLSSSYNWFFDHLNLQTLLFKTGFDRISLWEAGEELPDTRGVLRAVRVPGGVDLVALARKRPQRERFKLSIIVPVYNERRTFAELMTQLCELELPAIDKEIIIVESNSTDGTREEVLKFEGREDVHVIWQERARGKGHAVRAGLPAAKGDFIIIQDADLEYDLNDYSILLEPLVVGRQAFIIGSRHASNGWKIRSFTDARALASFFNIGHVVFTQLVNSLFDQNLDDPFSMFKVFRRDCVEGLSFECNGFDFDYELLIKLIRKGYRPVEIPVNYQSRSFAEGKKVSIVRDPVTWLRALYRYRTQPLSTFLTRPALEFQERAAE